MNKYPIPKIIIGSFLTFSLFIISLALLLPALPEQLNPNSLLFKLYEFSRTFISYADQMALNSLHPVALSITYLSSWFLACTLGITFSILLIPKIKNDEIKALKANPKISPFFMILVCLLMLAAPFLITQPIQPHQFSYLIHKSIQENRLSLAWAGFIFMGSYGCMVLYLFLRIFISIWRKK